MGASTSKEVIIPIESAYASDYHLKQSELSAQQNEAQAALHEVEERIFREGYSAGASDVMKEVSESVQKQAEDLFNQKVMENEEVLSQSVEKFSNSFNKKFFRPNSKDSICQKEADAVLACSIDSSNINSCKDPIVAYRKCVYNLR